MIFDAFERTVAFRYLRSRKGERFISITAVMSLLGIALGVAALIIVMSVMNGFRQDLADRIIGLNGHLTVQPARGRVLEKYAALADRIARIPGVRQVIPAVEGQSLLTGASGGAAAGLVRGISPADLRGRLPVAGRLRRGSLSTFGDGDTAVIGSRLAARMGLRPEDRLTLVLPQARGGDFTTAPRQRSFQVVAIFETGMPDVDARQVFIPIRAAQEFFDLAGDVSQIEVFVADPQQVSPVTAAVQLALSDHPVRVVDWQRINSSIYAAMLVERNVMFIILTLIVIVAAFNIISSLIMLVKDKRRDIAVLRTLGARRGSILRIFLICGAMLGSLGTMLGLVLGLMIASNFGTLRTWLLALRDTPFFSSELFYLTQLPVAIEPNEVLLVVVMGLALSLGATLYPSWRAARIEPAETLRHG
jgi:lipoprotein-releasing system permease protein